MTYGATPQEWSAWAKLAGPDLLPVVMDQSVKISEQSKMQALCKTPSRINQAGEAIGVPGWTSHIASDRDLGRWSTDSRLGICVIGRTVKFIDVDIEDPVRAREVLEFIQLGLGMLPRRRRSNSGKFLLAFRLPVDFPKRIIRTPHGIVELLSTKQQAVVCGTHSSGARIEWVDDSTGELGVPAELPEVTMAELDVVWQAVIDQFALPDGSSEERNGMMPVVPRQVGDMADPTVAWLDENGWVTGYERDGKVNVRCPFEDGHSTDSGPSSTTYFPAGVGGFAQGHFRCLHASCSKRTDGDFIEATGAGASEFTDETPLPGGQVATQVLPNFARTRTGQIEASLNNVLMALRRPDICGMRIAYDEFTAALMVDEGKGELRPFHDRDYVALASRLELDPLTGFKSIDTARLRAAVNAVGYEHRFDTAGQWIAGLKWDGVPRCERFFSTYFRTADTPYTRAVGLYAWTALAGRCVEPGEKCDMVPVLVGAQNAGKTTGVKAIAPHGDMFTEISLGERDDDLARKMRGTLVGEIGELRGLDSREEEAIKQWITRTHEEWTPKYMEYVTKYPRRLVLFGTTNRDDFLVDDTGNRRWLPMRVGAVDVPAIVRDRDQLWAEARELYAVGGVAWAGAYELAKAEHGLFKASDVWDDAIAEWLGRDDLDGAPRGPVRSSDVLVGALGVKVGAVKRSEEIRVAKCLARLGLVKHTRWIDGRAVKVWQRP